jgi:hypothetical protein
MRSDPCKSMGGKRNHAISSCPDRGAPRLFLHDRELSADRGIRKGAAVEDEPMADNPFNAIRFGCRSLTS